MDHPRSHLSSAAPARRALLAALVAAVCWCAGPAAAEPAAGAPVPVQAPAADTVAAAAPDDAAIVAASYRPAAPSGAPQAPDEDAGGLPGWLDVPLRILAGIGALVLLFELRRT